MASSFLEIVSRLFGWVYTLCWSLSFYPQPIVNFRRKSTSGTTVDFPAINILGFAAYFISNVAFLYSPHIRKEYALRHHGLTPTVQPNDVAFAAHATILSAITLSQYFPAIWGFDKTANRGSRISKGIVLIIIGSAIVVGGASFIVSLKHDDDPKSGWAWIDVVGTLSLRVISLTDPNLQIYTVSYIKLFVTLVKYFPQLVTNYRNRSTKGWSIAQILLDFAGGILSLAQLGIDSYLQHDWSGITGNPVKLALGNASIFFDILFMVQHYCLYTGKQGKALYEDEEDPLLGESRRPERTN